MKAPTSSTLTPRVPRIATALRFFDPITVADAGAPGGPVHVVHHAGELDAFSPATPIEATRISGSWCLALIPSSVSQTDLPQYSEASISRAFSFSTRR